MFLSTYSERFYLLFLDKNHVMSLLGASGVSPYQETGKSLLLTLWPLDLTVGYLKVKVYSCFPYNSSAIMSSLPPPISMSYYKTKPFSTLNTVYMGIAMEPSAIASLKLNI